MKILLYQPTFLKKGGLLEILFDQASSSIYNQQLVGDNVYREKYFDRNGAVEACFSLCPKSAFSILSRWKDRDVGWSDSQLPTLADKAVESELITPSSGWSLTAFSWDYGIDDFTSLCLGKETKKVNQQYILDCLIRDLRVRGVTGPIWKNIKMLCEKFGLYSNELLNINELYIDDDPYQSRSEGKYSRNQNKDNNWHDWANLLEEIDLASDKGLSKAISIFDELDAPRDPDQFWQEIFNLISVSKAGEFLISLSDAECADLYDINRAFVNFPESWKNKPGVKKSV